MVYISGEEMTRHTMELVLNRWVKPHVDISAWEFFDCSCKSRDATDDQVLHDAVSAGKKIRAIFKEPTVTPSAIQQKEMGLKSALCSPNGAMRRGWNGVSISRDTIHIDGLKLGYDNPVLFDRHAVGGEYGAGWKSCASGRLITTFFPDDESQEPYIIDSRTLGDDNNVAVVYHNPLDNVSDLGHHFFGRCFEAGVTPYVVTKKTVFKWQESFWTTLKDVFDEHYAFSFREKGLLDNCGGELQHLISDAATMQIIRWTKGGFGMVAHNYDGDMLTDEVAQVHRSPGFLTSNLVGKTDDGRSIKEFEASHGTVSDMWHDHLKGKETSLNPLGMVEALCGAIEHSAKEQPSGSGIKSFAQIMRESMHTSLKSNEGTRDMMGPKGLTTEQFVETVGARIDTAVAKKN